MHFKEAQTLPSAVKMIGLLKMMMIMMVIQTTKKRSWETRCAFKKNIMPANTDVSKAGCIATASTCVRLDVKGVLRKGRSDFNDFRAITEGAYKVRCKKKKSFDHKISKFEIWKT